MATKSQSPIGVILMTYGSATTSKNVKEFLDHVYPDGPDPELVQEFKRRFDVVHGSPLVAITIQQGKALQQLLDKEPGRGRYVVRVCMLHSAPFIDDSIAELKAAGITKIIGIIFPYPPLSYKSNFYFISHMFFITDNLFFYF